MVVFVALLGMSACSNSDKVATTDGGKSATAKGSNSSENVAVDQPGVTDTKIRVGGVASVTNPLGAPAASAFDGVQAYFNMVNDAGGIYGRKLVLASKRDDKLAANDAQTQALLEEDNVFAVLPVATYLFTAAPKLVAAGIPTFGWNISSEWGGTNEEPRANLFGHSGSTQSDVLPILPYTAMETKTHTLGLLSYNGGATKICTDAATNAVDRYGKEAELKLGFADAAIPYGTTDLAVQVTRMKQAGVDIVYPCMDFQGAVTLAKELKKQQLEAVLLMPNSYNPALTTDFSDLFQGDYAFTFFAPFETTPKGKGQKEFESQMEKAGYEVNENSVVGWINAAQFFAGLEAAGPEFTQQKVVDGINKMTDFNADGLSIPIDWTVRHYSTPEFCAGVTKVDGDKFVPAFTEKGKPFICWKSDAESVKDFTNK